MAVHFLLAGVWLFVALRLVCFRRNGARYRFWVSLAAYLMILGSFARVVAVGVEQAPVHWSELLVALALAVLAWRSRGNVACMIGRSRA